MGDALEYLLSPRPVEPFVREHWERSPLHVERHRRDYFRELFSMAAADELLARSDLWHPSVRVFFRGEQLGPEHLCGRWRYGRHEFDTILDRNKIFDLYRQGATINILGLERTWAPVMTVNCRLEEESGFPVHTNAFLTPRKAENIPPHYDLVDFFAVQVGGAKRWRLWKSDRALPLVEARDAASRIYRRSDSAVADDRLIGEYLLHAGDTLYVPRGVIHEAVTAEESSLHVTIGVNAHRRYGVIEGLAREGVRSLAAKARYRRALPPGDGTLAAPPRRQAEALFRAMVEDLRAFMHARLTRGYLAVDKALLRERYPARPGQLADLERLDALGLDDRVVRRPGIAYSLTREGARVLLRFHNKELSLPAALLPAVQDITATAAFAARELPDVLDDAGKLALVRRMVAEGFLTHADRPVPRAEAPGAGGTCADARALRPVSA